MILYFVRHASAGQHLSSPAQDDKRPLDRDGVEQCGVVGRTLAGMDVQVDAVISSPLKRATQTASLVANEIGFEGKLQLDPALLPDAPFESFRRLLDKYAGQEALMVVGHNPSLSSFVSLLITDGANEAAVDLKKGAVAKVGLTGKRTAVLTWCLTPKMARALQESVGTNSRPKTSRK